LADAITTKNITSVDEVQSVDNTDKVFVNDNGSFKQISVSNLMKQAPSGVTEETDPTVSEWAKQPTKPSYTADEVGALPVGTKIPTKTSDLTNDSGYLTQIPEEYVTETELGQKGYVIEDDIPEKLPSPGTLTFTGAVNDTYDGSVNKTINIPTGGGEGGTSDYNALSNKPKLNGVEVVGNKSSTDYKIVSSEQGIENNGKFLGVGVDGNVTPVDKPTYTADEVGARPDTWTPSAEDVGALPNDTEIPSKTSDLENDSGFITNSDIPEKLPNPQKIIFTGAVSAEYDGSSQQTINIPTDGGSEPYTLPIMSDTQLGGGKAVAKTDEDVPVAVDPSTGQLFVPTYPENTGGGGGTVDPEQIKQAVNGYLEENPVKPTPIDKTLTKDNEAADAKVTGNAIKNNSEKIDSLSEDMENIKNEGVSVKDKTITPEKTTFILTEQQENIVTEVTKYSNHPAAVVENGISSGTTIYYNIAGINSLNIFDSGTGGWVSANFSEYGTNSPYESNDSGAKGKFTVTKDIPKCLFYGNAVWTWENPVINTTGVFFDGAKITGISNEFLDALKTESNEIVKSGLENESGIITPEMTDFVNLNFMPIGKLDYSSPQMFYAVYLEKDKIYYCKSPDLLLYPNKNWVSNTPTPATPTGNGGFTIGNLETGTYYVKLDYIADADDRKNYADSYSNWVYSVPIGDNFVVNIGDYDLIPESDPVKRKIMEFTCDLVGKTWNALGDSNTQYPGGYQKWQSSNGQKGYVQYIGDKYYMSAKNNGTGGATWGTANSANAVNKVDSLVSDGVKWDIVTFSFGTNADTSMGTYESTSADKTSLAGAMRYCIETMQANFPLTKLGVILPTRRSDGNLSNDVLKQRCELMTSIAHDYGVPVCDMFNESGTITSWYSDGLHICNPGSWSMDKPACYHYESKLEKFLLSL